MCISGIELISGIDKDGIENGKHEEKTVRCIRRRLTRRYLESLVMTVVKVCPDYKST